MGPESDDLDPRLKISEARGRMGKEGSNSTELCGYPLQISHWEVDGKFQPAED